MFSLRLFPSFEKPVARQRYLNVQPQRRGSSGIGAVLALSALCGIGVVLALPATPQLSSAPSRAAVTATSNQAPITETTAAATATADDETFVKLSALCTDKPTARRACAEAKAAKEARLAAALARAEADTPKTPSAPAAVAGKASAAAKASTEPEEATAEAPSPRQKTKTARAAEEAPVDRLVHVYDHIAPDGRRVPVYRRSNGRYEFGAVVDGEYRQSRSAELGQPRTPSFFGLQ